MARNGEKAQSMLYRFREQQAVDMGLGNRTKGDRRPRMASSITSLRECERWRGDILRDISRKVSKIQDYYEIRDLNDEINQLMREKRHWETQIVNLGGANYKRAAGAMLGDDGKEVPGTRGYKYFGRAKELPGVKELFTRGSTQASEESARNASFQMFRHQGPEYYGDLDEMDEKLAEQEDALERQDWEAMAAHTAEMLSVTDVVPYPSSSPAESSTAAAATAPEETPDKAPAPAKKSTKRKSRAVQAAEAAEAAAEEEEQAEEAKKAKATEEEVNEASAVADPRQALARSFLGMLDPESLKQPVVPTPEEMAQILLDARKRALREEYGV